MARQDLALMAAVLAGTLLFAALRAWRGGDSRADTALMGGSGVALGSLAGVLFML